MWCLYKISENSIWRNYVFCNENVLAKPAFYHFYIHNNVGLCICCRAQFYAAKFRHTTLKIIRIAIFKNRRYVDIFFYIFNILIICSAIYNDHWFCLLIYMTFDTSNVLARKRQSSIAVIFKDGLIPIVSV